MPHFSTDLHNHLTFRPPFINTKDPTKKQLIFDAFVAIRRNEQVLVGFDTDISSASRRDLQELLEEMNFLGRSESWVRAGLVDHASDVTWNCVPRTPETPDSQFETVKVACLLPPQEFEGLFYLPEREEKASEDKSKNTVSWLEAICMSTKDLLDEGWSRPPGLLWVDYARSNDALRPRPAEKKTKELSGRFRCAKYALCSTVLPRVEETASFADRIRKKLMGIHKRIQDDDPSLVSQTFSGKDTSGRALKGHRHAFYLPLDEDGDGRLDHLLVYAADAFDRSELAALDRLQSIWQPNRRPDVQLVLVSLSAEVQGHRSRGWVSASPFITARHYRKGRGTYEEWLNGEIDREGGFHGLPQPSKITWIPHTLTTNPPIRWFEFIRSRKGVNPASGYGCILTFNEPVHGPFALGSGCHFGLGLFVPYGR